MTLLFADLETYSPVEISHGTHAYAEQAEVMLWAWAIDNGPVQCWDLTAEPMTPTDLLVALHSGTTIWHNGGNFDRVVLGHALPALCPPLERMHDTMAMALAHSLPGSLEKLGDILGLPQDQAKLKDGRALIQLFCKPRPKNQKLRRATRATHPAEWARFIEYAKRDVEAMRALYHKLPSWNYPRGAELALWQLDQRINARGVAVDLDLAGAAIRASDRCQKVLAQETCRLTADAVTAATQRDRLLAHILEAHGVELPDMKTSTLEKVLERDADLPPIVRELLMIRLQASKTSGAKYKRVLQGASRDGRLRGLLQFCGASRTGRWAGRLFQPQNLPRPTHTQALIDQGIAAMKADAEDLIFPDVMDLASSAIRGVIVAPPGKKLVVADLANIEGRMLAWLAGETWKLRAFRDFDAGTGHDLYKLAYASSFRVTPERVSKDQRQIGKVQELALGYQGGVGAFTTFALVYGIDLDQLAATVLPTLPGDVLEEARGMWGWATQKKRTLGLAYDTFVACDSLKRLWRRAHPETASLWRETEDAVRRAIATPGQWHACRTVAMRRDAAWLRIRLPSGRFLCYPSPRVADDGQISYMGINQYTRKWCRLKTYGGKLAENITQAASRDVLASSMQPIEDAGYEIVLTVHDEIISEAPDLPEFNSDHLAGLMATVPSWAEGLPLAAAGFEAYRYRKE